MVLLIIHGLIRKMEEEGWTKKKLLSKLEYVHTIQYIIGSAGKDVLCSQLVLELYKESSKTGATETGDM